MIPTSGQSSWALSEPIFTDLEIEVLMSGCAADGKKDSDNENGGGNLHPEVVPVVTLGPSSDSTFSRALGEAVNVC